MGQCVGWHCLTTAQKFGIIFSAAVVAILLGIAWMYYLGRVASSRNNRKSITLPGGRRIRRNPRVPVAVALGELPIAQSWPGHPPHVRYQPVIYSFDSPGGVRAHPYFTTGPYEPVRPPPLVYIPIRSQAAFSHEGKQRMPCREDCAAQMDPSTQRNIPRPASPNNHYQPRQPTWTQRLNRVLRLPIGRASTIASSISTERDNQTQTHSRESSQSAGIVSAANRQPVSSKEVQHPGSLAAEHTRQGDTASVHTQSSNAATVHSDDYDMVQPSFRQIAAIKDGGNATEGDIQGCKLNVGFYRKLSKPVATDKSSTSESMSNSSMLKPTSAYQSDLSLREATEGFVYR